MKLAGAGPGRWHVYQDVRADFFDQITAEVKAPHRSIRHRKVWQLRSGRRNEALDAEVYALHAARATRVHLRRPAEWDLLEAQVNQTDLFGTEPDPAEQIPDQQPVGAVVRRSAGITRRA